MRRRMLIAGLASLLAAATTARGTETAPNPSVLLLWQEKDSGQRLEIRGRVTDASGKPLAGAKISLRHAAPNGIYTGQYEGTVITSADGQYIVRTARPGSYGPPSHIHVEARHAGASSLYTEILFKGDPRLRSEREKQQAIVLETVRTDAGEAFLGVFDIQFGK